MYIRLSKNKTKSNYRKILEEALVLAKREYDFAPGIPLNVSIYNQLIDIKKTVVEENCIYTEEAASKNILLRSWPSGITMVTKVGTIRICWLMCPAGFPIIPKCPNIQFEQLKTINKLKIMRSFKIIKPIIRY